MVELCSRVQKLLDGRSGWQQGRRGPAAQRRLARLYHIEGRSGVAAEASPRPSSSFPQRGSLRDLGAKAAFAPEHPWPDRPRRGVVRRLDLGVTHKGPQRLAQFEDLSAGSLVFGTYRFGPPPAAVPPPGGSAT